MPGVARRGPTRGVPGPERLGRRQPDARRAVVGLRPAMQGALFLEQYLDAPACQMIAARSGVPVRREQVIEVGNLAALAPGGALVIADLIEPETQRGREVAARRWDQAVRARSLGPDGNDKGC